MSRMLLTGIIWGLHWSIHKMSNSFFLNLTWKPLRSQTHFHTEDEIKQFHFHICWCFITLLMLVLSRVSHVRFFVTLWSVVHQALCPWDSPGKNTGVGCHALLQGIFPTQRLNLCLLHCSKFFTNEWPGKLQEESNMGASKLISFQIPNFQISLDMHRKGCRKDRGKKRKSFQA